MRLYYSIFNLYKVGATALPAAWPSDPPLKKLPQLQCTTQILIIATVNIVEILS